MKTVSCCSCRTDRRVSDVGVFWEIFGSGRLRIDVVDLSVWAEEFV